MITEDYVSFETAKLLKDKGFDECTLLSYDKNGNRKDIMRPFLESEGDVRRPTLQMVMKWLRKEKGIAVIPVLSSVLDNERFLWDVKIVVAKTNDSYSQGWIYEEQEAACEAAIKYCLENLI